MPKKKKGDEDTDEKREKRRAKREKFLESCVGLGLQYEVQDCKVYILYIYIPDTTYTVLLPTRSGCCPT